MKNLLLFIILFIGIRSFGQSISVIDFVKIKDNKKAEALFFYEHNWKVYRDVALQKGFITSYQLLTAAPDSANNFDLMLVTVFADSVQYKLSETHFQPIIKSTRPDGPMLLNEWKPADFRINISSRVTSTLFEAEKKNGI